MGLLGKLLKKDPQKEMARIEEYLSRESYVQALESANRFARSADGEWRARAEELVARCRLALVESILARAEAAEAEGNLTDAADWIESALERLPADDPRHAELEASRDGLRSRIEEAEEEAWADRVEGAPAPDPSGDGDGYDADLHYQALVSMLDDDIAILYEEQPPRFVEAIVHLNEARTEEAETILNELLEDAPDDPILHLERGRCRLLGENPAAAREDFDVAWEALGDQPLDLAGTFSAPDLWAEAALADADPASVVQRLEDLAVPEAGRPTLTEHYATALLECERFDEARSFLARAASLQPGRQSLPYLLARALRGDGETSMALECLETAVGPSCASGHCGGKRRHLASVRLLAELHLEDENGDPERALELLTLIARDQGGRRSTKDLDLLARYQERDGKAEAAARLREEAARLREAGETLTEADYKPPALGGGRRSVL